MKNVTIAIQRRGKLRAGSQQFLERKGVLPYIDDSVLRSSCEQSGSDILYLRDDDIPEYILRGVADYGIVGENVVYEKSANVTIVQRLGFGLCNLVIAVPNNSGITSVSELDGERIATSYPNILQRYLGKQGVRASIITIQGSVEIAPELNLADAVCDITQTGNTLKEHNLRPLEIILKSEAVLIKNEL